MLELDEKRTIEDEIQKVVFGASSTEVYLEFFSLTATVLKRALSQVRERWLEVVDFSESLQHQFDALEKFYMKKATVALKKIETEMREAFRVPEHLIVTLGTYQATDDEFKQLSQEVSKLEDELFLAFKTHQLLKMKKSEIEKFNHFIEVNNLKAKVQEALSDNETERLLCRDLLAESAKLFPEKYLEYMGEKQ